MKQLFLLLLAATSSIGVFAQGEIPVDMYTGTPEIFIDLYTLTDHDLSENFRMIYNPNDVKPGASSAYGLGWSLSVGGSISREVRGLPDDFSDGTRLGWLYNVNYNNITNFSNTADLSKTTYGDELTDYNYINNLHYNIDTEPDLFRFSVGGVSGQFMFNNNGGISLIPYQDILIVPTYSGVSPAIQTITGWTITTNTGIVYTFNEPTSITKSITKSDALYKNTETGMKFFERDFKQYGTAVTYSPSWMLSTIKSFTGATLTYSYAPVTSSLPVVNNKVAQIFDASYATGCGTWWNVSTFTLMDENTLATTTKTLYKISSSNGVWANVWGGSGGFDLYDPARSTRNPFKSFAFAYQSGMLSSITESGQCSSMAPYQFSYNGSIGNLVDFWGYCNGSSPDGTSHPLLPTIYVYPSEPANERYRLYPIPSYSGTQIVLNGYGDHRPSTNITLGMLNRIIYPSGGESDFAFEPNMYFDTKVGKDQLGGGVRIGSITYFDGVNPLAKITKTFSYTDASGHSSGKLIKRPTFAIPVWEYITPSYYTQSQPCFPVPYPIPGTIKSFSTLSASGTTALWRGLTVVTAFDLNKGESTNNGSSVGYTQVTVTRQGSGKAVYNYLVPAAYGDAATGSGPTDWAPTTMKFVRGANWDMSIINAGETWGHPQFPTQLYDYERGWVWKKSEYNNNNVLIRSTQTSYQYVYKNGSTPTNIVGLAYDNFANSIPNTIYLYGKYTQLADVRKVIATETVTTYDENNVTLNSTESTQNFYTSSTHQNVTRINNTTADGTIYGTSFKYSLDYPYIGGTLYDSTLSAIKLLNDQNRTSTVIEQIGTVQPAGGTEKTTGASLIKYRQVMVNNVPTALPRFQLAYRPDTPGSFTASYSSGNVFYYFNDPHYQTTNTINEYDNYGLPISATAEDKTTKGTLWGYGQRLPVANFSQARSISIGFSDFETTTVSSFTEANKFTGAGRTGVKGVHPYATLTRTIVKPASAASYILSFWAKPAAGNTSLTLQVLLNGAAAAGSPYTFTYTTGNSDYQYFTKAIDVTGMPATFTIAIQGVNFTQPSGSSPSLLPMLDDVGFYPDYAAISSMTYDIPFGVNSSSSPSGLTSFNTYDSLGRINLVFDHNHNIRERYTYAVSGQVLPSLIASIIGYSSYYVNTPFQLAAASNLCLTNVTYSWDFDNQNLFTATGPMSPTQNYSSTGSHTATVRVSHPEYGQKTATFNYTIVNPPPPVLGVTISDTFASNWFTFTAAVTNTNGAGVAYQWKQRNSGSSTWNLVGTSSPTYKVKILPGTGTSVDVMCTVTTDDNRTADSFSITISN